MYDCFLGNYERVIGRNAHVKINNEFVPCRVTGYLFKTRKYQVVTDDGEAKHFDKIYVTQ